MCSLQSIPRNIRTSKQFLNHSNFTLSKQQTRIIKCNMILCMHTVRFLISRGFHSFDAAFNAHHRIEYEFIDGTPFMSFDCHFAETIFVIPHERSILFILQQDILLIRSWFAFDLFQSNKKPIMFIVSRIVWMWIYFPAVNVNGGDHGLVTVWHIRATN